MLKIGIFRAPKTKNDQEFCGLGQIYHEQLSIEDGATAIGGRRAR